MTRFWLACWAVPVFLCATEGSVFACSCARVFSFQERIEAAPVVVVGRVASVGELPPQVETAPNVTTVRPPFMGAGVTVAVASVVKGEVPSTQIRVWDLAYGECFNALRGYTIGTSIVVGLWPVTDTPPGERSTWGAASFIPESDYFATGACGQSLRVLSAEEVLEWTGRKQ